MALLNESTSQVFMGLELVAVALDLADKLLDDPTDTDWFAVVDHMKIEWAGVMDFEEMVAGESDLMQFLREQVVYWNEAIIDDGL